MAKRYSRSKRKSYSKRSYGKRSYKRSRPSSRVEVHHVMHFAGMGGAGVPMVGQAPVGTIGVTAAPVTKRTKSH